LLLDEKVLFLGDHPDIAYNPNLKFPTENICYVYVILYVILNLLLVVALAVLAVLERCLLEVVLDLLVVLVVVAAASYLFRLRWYFMILVLFQVFLP
jgi:hypothetical protein